MGERTLLLSTTSTNDVQSYVGLVTFNPVLAECIKYRARKFSVDFGHDPLAREHSYLSDHCEFLADAPLPDDVAIALSKNSWVELVDIGLVDTLRTFVIRLDLPRMVVSRDEVSWTASPRYSDEFLRSSWFSYDQLTRCASCGLDQDQHAGAKKKKCPFAPTRYVPWV